MPRGRPLGSQVRQNIISLLTVVGKPMYGYMIHKLYIKVFPPCTREVVYYHLDKGLHLGHFVLTAVKQEKGNFSWGGIVEKRYYAVGSKAEVPGIDPSITAKILAVQKELNL